MRTFHLSGGRRAGKRLARALRLVQPPVLDASGIHGEGAGPEPSPAEYGSFAYPGLHGHSVVAGQRAPSIGDSLSGGTTEVSGWDPYRFSEIPIHTSDVQAEYWYNGSTYSRSMVGLANGSTGTFQWGEQTREQDRLNLAWQQQANRLANPVWIHPTRLDPYENYYHLNMRYFLNKQWMNWPEPLDPDLVMDVGL